ncbi:acetolactate synthase small subunit [Oleidesulfovibrio sp.]|uniref:acetolactate synthase small subunit n=1 Tax=Oleidesulfovibrio sp. TaxID=2909707 RepID=UPI003A87DA91
MTAQMQQPDTMPPLIALRLTVRNHPGVMSHVCGLFARRAFNVEGILCTPVGDGTISRIWLIVHEDSRLQQMIRQAEKLQDVHDVAPFPADAQAFARLESCVAAWETADELCITPTAMAG